MTLPSRHAYLTEHPPPPPNPFLTEQAPDIMKKKGDHENDESDGAGADEGAEEGIAFIEKDGKCYCEHDYQELFGPRCAECGLVFALESEEAFQAPAPKEGGGERPSDLYCKAHYEARYGRACLSARKVSHSDI